jgi:hypothetical protein
VPPKIVLALIENATVEYEDDLHTLWANLLATGLDATADEIQRQYVSILSNLSSNDRELLNALCLEWTKSGEVSFPEDFRSRSTIDEISLITLNKLGLVAPKIIDSEIYGPETTDGIRVYPPEKQIVEAQGSDLEFTPLGIAFCKAVILE